MPSGSSQSKRIFFRPTAVGSFNNRGTAVFVGDSDPSNNIVDITVRVTANLRDGSGELELSYRTALELEPPTGGGGQIIWNGSSAQETTASGEFVHLVRAIEGENRVVAHWTGSGAANGSWRFDFSSAAQFVPGSIRVESGQVLSQSGSAIIFALRPGAPFPQFTLQVGEGQRDPLR